MSRTCRDAAVALTVGACAALLCDGLLRLLTAAVQMSNGPSAPWYATLGARAVWVVAALLLWVIAPWLASGAGPGASAIADRIATWRAISTLLAAMPVVYLIARHVVFAFQLTVAGAWEYDGAVLAQPSYYSQLLLELLPWLAGAAVVATLSRHLDPS